MVVQAILRIPELLVQLGYHQLLAHQWLSWFAAWLTFKESRVRYHLHLFPFVITWFISSMAAVNWDRLNATTVLWVWSGWWCKILKGWLCKPSWEWLNGKLQIGYYQLLAHQWLSWFAAWLTFKEARVRFPAMAVCYLHLFPCVITWFMVVQAILRIPELLVQLGYHQLLAHQWLSWFAAWLMYKEARVRFPAMAVYYLHLFPCVITWFISSMAAVNWDRLNATTVLWVWSGWWCKILKGWLCKPSWEFLNC